MRFRCQRHFSQVLDRFVIDFRSKKTMKSNVVFQSIAFFFKPGEPSKPCTGAWFRALFTFFNFLKFVKKRHKNIAKLVFKKHIEKSGPGDPKICLKLLKIEKISLKITSRRRLEASRGVSWRLMASRDVSWRLVSTSRGVSWRLGASRGEGICPEPGGRGLPRMQGGVSPRA